MISAICLAPMIVGEAGYLLGKKVTAWNGDGMQKPALESYGAEFVDQSVVVDGRS